MITGASKGLYTRRDVQGRHSDIRCVRVGIGAGIALGFARTGAAVVLVARQQSTLEESEAEILKAVPGARTLTVVADVIDWRASEAAVEAAVKHFGRLSVLVCNAGTTTKMETRAYSSVYRLGFSCNSS